MNSSASAEVNQNDAVACLFHLHGWRLKLSAEDAVPEATGDTKAKFVVQEVMLKVVLLEVLVPEWQVLVVQEVVRQVIADVAKDATTVDSGGGMPAVGEDGMGQLPKWSCKDNKESRGHDKSVFVHGQVMMNAMEQEVSGDTNAVIGKIAVHVY